MIMENKPLIQLCGTIARDTERLEAQERRHFANIIVGTLLRPGIAFDLMGRQERRERSGPV